MSSEVVEPPTQPLMIRAQGIGKSYRMYRRPADRLWELLWPGRKAWSQEFVALQDVSLELRRGEVLGIVGVNGAGKSTLLQLVTGTISPTQGSVQTHGRVAAILELGSGFNPDFTGRENIYLNAATLGLDKAEIDQRLDAIIEFAGIGLHIDQPVKTYSSGMVIRLAFSIATSVDADVLIIDEALSVGDGAFRRRSFERIMQIKQSGATILFCSHVLFHVEAFCDRALWLHGGRVQKLGMVSEVLRPYEEFLDIYENDPSAQPMADGPHPLPSLSGAAQADREVQLPASPPSDARLLSVKVRLDGQEGTELQGRSQQSRLEVDLVFASDPRQPAPTAAMVLSSESGKILASTLSHTHGVVFERNASGLGTASFGMDRLPLNKGRYRVGVYLFCENGLHGYAMMDPLAHIELAHSGHEQGAMLLQGTWQSGTPVHTRAPT